MVEKEPGREIVLPVQGQVGRRIVERVVKQGLVLFRVGPKLEERGERERSARHRRESRVICSSSK